MLKTSRALRTSKRKSRTYDLYFLFLVLILSAIHGQIIKVKETEDVPMVLVGNKCDLEDKRQVTHEDATSLAKKKFKGHYFECSAKLAKNINELFTKLVELVAEKYPPIVKRSSCSLF